MSMTRDEAIALARKHMRIKFNYEAKMADLGKLRSALNRAVSELKLPGCAVFPERFRGPIEDGINWIDKHSRES